MPPSLQDLLEARVAYPADVSADGHTVLVLSNLTGTLQLYRTPIAGGELERLTDFREPVNGVFVPGSERILFQMDDAGNERTQLYLLDARPGAAPEPIVHDPRFVHRAPQVSRDGGFVAYSSNRRNGVDFDVYVRRLASGHERCVFDRGGWAETAGISPGGRWVAVTVPTELSGDNDLYLVDPDSGEIAHVSPHEGDALFGSPAWLDDETFLLACSDGRDSAAIARYDMGSRSYEYVLEDRWDLEPHTDPSGATLVVEANEDGYTRLELRDPQTLELLRQVPLPGRGVVPALALSDGGGLVAFHFTSPRVPGDVWVFDTSSGELSRLTESSSDVDPADLVEPELHRFESFDGESIPVFLYSPEAGARAPVVVNVHGGPEAQARAIFSPLAQYLVSRGFAVAFPNVRGSTGYGKRYGHLDDGPLRLDSVRDLVALRDWLAADARFDAERVALYGGSYGGYMVLAGLAFHPDCWSAGVDIVGISSLVTFLENTAAYRRAFREREYGSLEHDRDFLISASPITHVDRIRAPLLLIHGANDPRVPLGEAEQIHRALADRGVPCELLVYEDEGHGLQKLENRLDAFPRAAAFLEDVLGSS